MCASVSSQASRVWITIGLRELRGDFQLPLEHALLHVARREIVVVVQADLADRQHFRMLREIAHAGERLLGGLATPRADAHRWSRRETDGASANSGASITTIGFTPAASARSITASRSASNFGSLR